MSHVRGQNSLTRWGNNDLNFRLGRDQVVHLETAANLCASRHQANIFFSVCSISKHFMTGPLGKSEFCFPSTLSVPIVGFGHLFPLGMVIKCLLFTSDQSTCWSGNFMLSKILNTTLNTSLHQCC